MAAPDWVHKILAKHGGAPRPDAPRVPSARPAAFAPKRPVMTDIELHEPKDAEKPERVGGSRAQLAAFLSRPKRLK